MRIPRALTVVAFVGAFAALAGARTQEINSQERVPAVSGEDATLQSIQEEAAADVDALVRRVANLPDGPERADLDRQIIEIKTATRIRLLETLITFARERGDEATAEEAAHQLALVVNPPAVPADVAAKIQTAGKEEMKEVQP